MQQILIVSAVFFVYTILLYIWFKQKLAGQLNELKADQARLGYIEKMASLGTLSGGIAHEINNPLAFLTTNLDYLSNNIDKFAANNDPIKLESQTAEIKEILIECQDGAARIRRIVADLLAFARPAKGKEVLVDIASQLDAVVRVLWNELKYKTNIVKEYAVTTKIIVDANQLSQVFFNIIINAAQSIKEKGTIKIEALEDPDNVIIKISDSGQGISAQNLRKIFEPFYTTKGGTGLGLYISKQIMDSLGGRIEVESTLEKGSSFTLVLPKEKKEVSR